MKPAITALAFLALAAPAYYLNGSWEIPRVFEFALCELENRIEAEKKND